MSYYDDEAIENERHDADVEQAGLEAAGNAAARGHRGMMGLRAAGKLAEAAARCHHGWGYATSSPAATNDNDPRAGQPGHRCLSCGSWWDGATAKKVSGKWGVLLHELRGVPPTAPCELAPRQ